MDGDSGQCDQLCVYTVFRCAAGAEWVRKGNGVIAGINKLCARDEFDCSSGIALSGTSQGGGVAVQVSKLYSGVNALLTKQWAPLLGGGAPQPLKPLPGREEDLTCFPRIPSHSTGVASTTRVTTHPLGRPYRLATCNQYPLTSTPPPCPRL